ncbi:MAG: DUF5050 domain-containing protein [Clostridia bacterium]|nr:DUF5050 domain-containing protein [Clostridia bacterium]
MVVVMTALNMVACAPKLQEDDDKPTENPYVFTALASDPTSSGKSFATDEGVYTVFRNTEDRWFLLFLPHGTTEVTVVSDVDEAILKFEKVGDMLYFQTVSGPYGNRLWTVPCAGGTPTPLALPDDHFLLSKFSIADGYIYYGADYDETRYAVFRMQLETGTFQKLAESTGEPVPVVLSPDGFVYYRDDGQSYCVRPDGSGLKAVAEMTASDFYYDGWRYTLDPEIGYIMRQKGIADATPISLQKYEKAYFTNTGIFAYTSTYVVGESIYRQTLYRMDLNGANVQKISEERLADSELLLADGWLYYFAYDQNVSRWCRIRPDGTEKTLLY